MAVKPKKPLLRYCAQISVACLAAAGISGHAVAGPHEDAKAANQRGDYVTELRIVEPEAAEGHAWAQNNLGNLYIDGNGVAVDDALALAWFSKAAAQGDPNGEINVGQLYEKGLGVPGDPVRAASLYLMAGEQGSAGGWSMLKRLCDHDKAVAANECALIPKGTQSTPDWDFHGKANLLVSALFKLLIAGIAIFFSVKRFRTLKAKKSSTFVMNTSGAEGGTSASGINSSNFVRFILRGSIGVAVLMMAPVVYIAIKNPSRTPWSAPMVLWVVGLFLAWCSIVIVRARGFRKA